MLGSIAFNSTRLNRIVFSHTRQGFHIKQQDTVGTCGQNVFLIVFSVELQVYTSIAIADIGVLLDRLEDDGLFVAGNPDSVVSYFYSKILQSYLCHVFDLSFCLREHLPGSFHFRYHMFMGSTEFSELTRRFSMEGRLVIFSY